MSDITMWEIENSLYSETVQLICGVDEAGRGPLAGPVCAAAVILVDEFRSGKLGKFTLEMPEELK